MTEQNPYEKLGITADASFEEVQNARDRLLSVAAGDTKQAEHIEAAYDAVLMERLRLRQEGKIKVPELIRFPDRPSELLPSLPTVSISGSPKWQGWLQSLRDTPDRSELIRAALVFGALGILCWLLPLSSNENADGVLQVCLALGLGFSLYALNLKERKFGRACLLSVVGLLVGLILGSAIAAPLGAMLPSVGLNEPQATTLFTLVVLWLITSFAR